MNATKVPSQPFLEEFQNSWRRVPDKSIFFVLFAGWIALFQFFGLSGQTWTGNHSLFARLWMLYSGPESDLEYAKLIPPAILILLWQQRQTLAVIAQSSPWLAFAMFAIATGLQMVGFLAQQESISAVAFFLGLYSLVGLAWGWRVMRAVFFPFFLLCFCVPLGSLMETLTFRLRIIATTLTEFVAHTLLGVPLTREGTRLIKPNGHAFEIVAACSGLRSFTALLVVTIIYSMISFRSFGRRAFLIAITVPLAVGCNVLRLTAMVVADRAFGPKAGAFVHDTDWIFTYGVAIAVIMALGHWLREKGPCSGAMKSKWIVSFLALVMLAASAAFLHRMQDARNLTEPGVRVSAAPIYDENKRLLSTQSVVLPERLPGLNGFPMPITEIEAKTLPPDTTFGRRVYGTNHFETQATVVLMGTDRASIHRPQWCLVGGGWDITSTRIDDVPMTRPYPYKLPVNVLVTSRRADQGTIAGVYVYWYVSKDKITANQLGRLWSVTWTALTTGVRERWAYISYFAPCLPGQERATFERLQTVISDSVPEFQIVSGPRDDQPASMTARN